MFRETGSHLPQRCSSLDQIHDILEISSTTLITRTHTSNDKVSFVTKGGSEPLEFLPLRLALRSLLTIHVSFLCGATASLAVCIGQKFVLGICPDRVLQLHVTLKMRSVAFPALQPNDTISKRWMCLDTRHNFFFGHRWIVESKANVSPTTSCGTCRSCGQTLSGSSRGRRLLCSARHDLREKGSNGQRQETTSALIQVLVNTRVTTILCVSDEPKFDTWRS